MSDDAIRALVDRVLAELEHFDEKDYLAKARFVVHRLAQLGVQATLDDATEDVTVAIDREHGLVVLHRDESHHRGDR